MQKKCQLNRQKMPHLSQQKGFHNHHFMESFLQYNDNTNTGLSNIRIGIGTFFSNKKKMTRDRYIAMRGRKKL